MLRDEIKSARIAAMKAHDKSVSGVLSVVLNKIMLAEIEIRAKGGELKDADVVQVLQKSEKELLDEREGFEKAGRADRVEDLNRQIEAVKALGAEGVQIGTRFALSQESSAHRSFKEHCINLGEGDTRLLLKKISPTRLACGSLFTETVEKMENEGATKEALQLYLGKGRAKKGIFEGEIDEGEIEIGQSASLINSIESVEQIMESLI